MPRFTTPYLNDPEVAAGEELSHAGSVFGRPVNINPTDLVTPVGTVSKYSSQELLRLLDEFAPNMRPALERAKTNFRFVWPRERFMLHPDDLTVVNSPTAASRKLGNNLGLTFLPGEKGKSNVPFRDIKPQPTIAEILLRPDPESFVRSQKLPGQVVFHEGSHGLITDRHMHNPFTKTEIQQLAGILPNWYDALISSKTPTGLAVRLYPSTERGTETVIRSAELGQRSLNEMAQRAMGQNIPFHVQDPTIRNTFIEALLKHIEPLLGLTPDHF